MDWLDVLESICGWIYFLAWSASWYPQQYLFIKRKTTAGYSTNYLVINIVGYISYSISNFSAYFNPSVIGSFEKHTSFAPQVDFSDVVFAIHGAVLCVSGVILVLYYPPRTPPRAAVWIVCLLIQTAVFIGLIQSIRGKLDWYNYLTVTSMVKVLSTLTKYIPQAYLNFQRKSTIGWSYSAVVQDVVGGVFSLLQQAVHCIKLGNLEPFTGNLAKLWLALVSLFFDAIFIFQYNYLYTSRVDIDLNHDNLEKAYFNEVSEYCNGEDEESSLFEHDETTQDLVVLTR